MVNKNLIAILDSYGRVHIWLKEPTLFSYKIKISKRNEEYTYDINNKGEEEVYPLQLGNGTYTIILYRKIINKKYIIDGKLKIKLKLDNPLLPFLYPNQFINYKNIELPTFSNIKEIKKYLLNFQYDYVKATKVSANQLPDISNLLKTKMGICQDLAALMVACCRANNIPAKLVIGYADKNYHAWCNYYKEGKWYRYDPTAKLFNKIIKKYTIERFY